MLQKMSFLIFRSLLILLGVSFLSFLLIYLAPGDPAKNMLSAQGIPYTQELLEAKRIEFGFQDPFWVQYGRWLGQMLQGNFGLTYHSGSSVAKELTFYFPHTILLALFTLWITLVMSLPLGFYLAYRPESLGSRLVATAVTVVNALPNFVLGIGLMLLLALKWQVLPIQSSLSIEGLILPSLTLAFTMSSRYIPQLEEGFRQILRSDTVQGAKGRGLSDRQVFQTTIFPQLLPLLLTLVTLSLSSLLGGVAVVEYLFSYPGIGRMLITAVTNRDFPLIQGAVLAITASVLVVNTGGELIQLWLNPKLRKGRYLHEVSS